MNASTAILHDLLDRGIYLEGWSTQELKKILPILEAAHERVLGKVSGGEYTREWLAEVKASIDEIYGAAAKEIEKRLMPDLEGLASEESAAISGTFGKVLVGVSVTAPAAAQLWAAIKALPAMEGSTIGDLLAALPAQVSSETVAAIQQGILSGDTTMEMVRRLRGTYNRKTKEYEGGALDSNSAKAIVRTATQHVGNEAREAFYKQNEDIIKGYQWCATLDLRTCPVCGQIDGRVWMAGDPRSAPPLHPSCRCVIVPVLKSFRELGLDMDLPPSTRASMDGQVAEFETYKDFLAKASNDRLIEALGPSRAALYRKGIGIDEMVRDGKLVPLKDIRAPKAEKKGTA